jgi:hypothetical protein
LLQPQPPQPRRNVHAALPVVEPASLVGFKLPRSAARSVLFHRSSQRPANTPAADSVPRPRLIRPSARPAPRRWVSQSPGSLERRFRPFTESATED